MLKEMIKEIAGYFNKTVVFETEFGQVTPKTRTFKLGEDIVGENRYITTARIEEEEEYVKVIKINVRTINNEKFLELNPGRV